MPCCASHPVVTMVWLASHVPAKRIVATSENISEPWSTNSAIAQVVSHCRQSSSHFGKTEVKTRDGMMQTRAYREQQQAKLVCAPLHPSWWSKGGSS